MRIIQGEGGRGRGECNKDAIHERVSLHRCNFSPLQKSSRRRRGWEGDARALIVNRNAAGHARLMADDRWRQRHRARQSAPCRKEINRATAAGSDEWPLVRAPHTSVARGSVLQPRIRIATATATR